MRTMRRLRYTYLLIFIVWAGASAFALPQPKQPSAWSTTPKTSKDLQPSYQFRSTSAYKSVVGEGNIFFTKKQETNTPAIIGDIPYPSMATTTSGKHPLYSKPRRESANPWDEDPTGDPVGAVPVGEPWVLILMAVLYIFYTNRKKIQEKFAYIK